MSWKEKLGTPVRGFYINFYQLILKMEHERLNMTFVEFCGVYLTRYGHVVKAQADFVIYPAWL